ncbi:DENN domain-containing protein 3 [Hondaea fermentalgiana]|uniref:DENN domain-containing protein 3 n=1 Tax=Hondaea fermentalgiana TaxID=2315210 RepID=A0A2R5GJH9_9STRA|nr:DENN domain-containing protein 3 [Hondaea fermentalgiana]|eukprot:GBG31042.1 DENN domain-containing protein 3 [Hondaea fermentalgiana]
MVLGDPVAVSFEEVVRLGAQRPCIPVQEEDFDPLATSSMDNAKGDVAANPGQLGKPSSAEGNVIGIPIEREKWCRPAGSAYRLPLVQGNQRRHILYDVYFSGRSIGLTLSNKDHTFVQALTGVAAFKLGIIAKGDIILSASCEDRWIRCNESLNELTDFIRDSKRPIVLRFWRRPEPLQLGSVLISNGPLEVFLNFVNRYLDSPNYREVSRNERALEQELREEAHASQARGEFNALVGSVHADDLGRVGGTMSDNDDDEVATLSGNDDDADSLDGANARHHGARAAHASHAAGRESSRKYINTAVAQIMFLVEVVKIRQRIKTGTHRYNQATVESSIRKGIAAKYLMPGKQSDFSIRDFLRKDRAAASARKEVLRSGSIEALELLFDHVQDLVRNDTFALFLHEKDVEIALDKLGEKNGWKLRVFSRLVRQIVPLELILERRKACAAFLLYLLGLEPSKESTQAATSLSIWSTARFCPSLFHESFVPVARRERAFDEASQSVDFSVLHDRLLVLCKDFHRQFVHHKLGRLVWDAFNAAAKTDGNEALLDNHMPRLSAILQEANLPDYLNTHRAVAPLPLASSSSSSLDDPSRGDFLRNILLFDAPVDKADPIVFSAVPGESAPPQIERFFLPHRLGGMLHDGVGEDDPNQYPLLFNFVMGSGLVGSSLSFRHVNGRYTGVCITSERRDFFLHRKLLQRVAADHRPAMESELTEGTDGGGMSALGPKVRATLNDALSQEHAAAIQAHDQMPSLSDSLDFGLLFEIFSYEDIIRLFECCLLERKMLFVAKRYTALTNVAEVLRELLQPLQWSHVYAPVLPRKMLDHLQCPTPFMIGIHTDYAFKKDFPFVLDAVVVNLDHGTIQMPSMTARGGGDALAAYDDDETLGRHLQLPQELRAHLLQDLRRLTQPRYEACDSLAEPSSSPASKQIIPAAKVRESFGVVVAKLLEQVVPHCVPLNFSKSDSLIIFNEMRFLDAVNPAHRTFYAALLRTQAFSTYASSFLNHLQHE